LPLAGGEYAKFSAVVTRETASADGSLVFYVNGTQLGDAITITSAATTSIDITNSLIICGSDSGVRYASDTTNAIIYNRALTAAEVLSLAVNGAALADIGASQVIKNTSTATNTNYTTFTDASVTGFTATSTTSASMRAQLNPSFEIRTGKKVRVSFSASVASGQLPDVVGLWSGSVGLSNNVAAVSGSNVIELTATASSTTCVIRFQHNSAQPSSEYTISSAEVVVIGITGQWNAQDAQSNTGQIFDSSGNKNHALLPASGATIIGRPTSQPQQVRWTNTWAETSELQYIGGVNQAILPAKAYIESIVGVITSTGGSGVQDIIIGDGSDTDRYVTITTGLAAGTTSFTLANRTTDGTNRKLTVDPDTNATMSIAWVITYTTLE
jgi:hypothetical protein